MKRICIFSRAEAGLPNPRRPRRKIAMPNWSESLGLFAARQCYIRGYQVKRICNFFARGDLPSKSASSAQKNRDPELVGETWNFSSVAVLHSRLPGEAHLHFFRARRSACEVGVARAEKSRCRVGQKFLENCVRSSATFEVTR